MGDDGSGRFASQCCCSVASVHVHVHVRVVGTVRIFRCILVHKFLSFVFALLTSLVES